MRRVPLRHVVMAAVVVVAVVGFVAVMRVGLRLVDEQEAAQAKADRPQQFEYRHRGTVVYVLQSARTGHCYLGAWRGGLVEVAKEECE